MMPHTEYTTHYSARSNPARPHGPPPCGVTLDLYGGKVSAWTWVWDEVTCHECLAHRPEPAEVTPALVMRGMVVHFVMIIMEDVTERLGWFQKVTAKLQDENDRIVQLYVDAKRRRDARKRR